MKISLQLPTESLNLDVLWGILEIVQRKEKKDQIWAMPLRLSRREQKGDGAKSK